MKLSKLLALRKAHRISAVRFLGKLETATKNSEDIAVEVLLETLHKKQKTLDELEQKIYEVIDENRLEEEIWNATEFDMMLDSCMRKRKVNEDIYSKFLLTTTKSFEESVNTQEHSVKEEKQYIVTDTIMNKNELVTEIMEIESAKSDGKTQPASRRNSSTRSTERSFEHVEVELTVQSILNLRKFRQQIEDIRNNHSLNKCFSIMRRSLVTIDKLYMCYSYDVITSVDCFVFILIHNAENLT